MRKYLKLLPFVIIGVVCIFGLTGCESLNRAGKNLKSDFSGGLSRHIVAYDYSGNTLYEYTGKIDIEENENKVLFDTEDGRRIILYNAIVITEEVPKD